MLKKLIFLVLTIFLITIGVLYLLQDNDVEEEIINENENIINETEEEPEEPIVEEETSTPWEVFENIDYSYTFQYQPDWTINSEDMERIWIYLPAEDASILFASDTATQTGFPEYELISSYEFTLNNGEETTVSVLESEGTKAIISVFNGEEYPHFVMMTYGDQNLDESMIELNDEFLSRITFQ